MFNAIDTSTGEVCPNQAEYGFNLLIEEPPLQVLPSLAEAIGLEEAIVIQQLHYYERKGYGKTVKGMRWIFNTYEEWKKVFPFWSERTIQRIFLRLEGMHLVESCIPEGGISRRKYYRINRGGLNLLRKGKMKKPDSPSCQVGTMVVPNMDVPNTKTTYIESKETKETPSRSEEGEPSFPSVWKPRPGDRESKLSRLRPPSSYPSETEFDSFLCSHSLDHIETYKFDLYSLLCQNKWHQWKPELQKWIRIRDWRAYVMALDLHIQDVR